MSGTNESGNAGLVLQGNDLYSRRWQSRVSLCIYDRDWNQSVSCRTRNTLGFFFQLAGAL